MVVGELARPVEVLVIGGGPGGYTCAARLAELGKEVVLVEANLLGGTCLNVGCIPSKVLITVAEHISASRSLSRAGVVAQESAVNLSGAVTYKDLIVEELRGGVRNLLSSVEILAGTARFLDDRRVSVETGDQVQYLQFSSCVIATGSTPGDLLSLPFDGDRVLDSTGILELTELPGSLSVIGGGVIGLELGTAFAKLGTKVTIVEATGTIGAGFEEDLVNPVEARLAELDVSVLTQARVAGINPGGLEVETDGGLVTVPADRVLVSIGRTPVVKELQLENAHVELDPSGFVLVDEFMRTSSAQIYAIGDIVPGPALAHKASSQGRVAAEVIAGLPSAFDSVVPSVAYTEPEMATVGMTASSAQESGYAVVVGKARMANSGRSRTMGNSAGLVKTVFESDSRILLGVQITAPNASEIIAEGAVLIEMAATIDDVIGTVHPHPSLIESLRDAAIDAFRRLERSE